MEQIEVNFENLTEEEQTQLRELINKAKWERWRPKEGESYYAVTHSSFGYYAACFRWDNDKFDSTMYANNILYRTRKEAEFVAEKKNVERELELFAYEHNDEMDWNRFYEKNYYFYFDHERRKIGICSVIQYQSQGIYFSSEELCRQAIEKVGEERIKKYLFVVE